MNKSTLSLPRGWTKSVRVAVLHVIALAQVAAGATRETASRRALRRAAGPRERKVRREDRVARPHPCRPQATSCRQAAKGRIGRECLPPQRRARRARWHKAAWPRSRARPPIRAAKLQRGAFLRSFGIVLGPREWSFFCRELSLDRYKGE